MPEIQSEQRSPEWFKAREGKITGSVVGAILGLSPYMSASDVLENMIKKHQGYEVKFPDNPALAHGQFYEEYAISDLEMLHDINVKECGLFVHPTSLWLAASPDGTIGADGVAEIKCPYGIRNDNPPKFKTVEELPHYYAQMQIEMYCTERKYCVFYQWTPHGDDLRIVNFDQAWLDENLHKLAAFYNRYMDERDIPLDRFDHLALQLDEAKAKFDEAKEAVEAIRMEMIMAADGNKARMGKYTVQEIKKKGSVNYSKIVKEQLPEFDLEPYRGASSTHWTIK